MTDNPNRGEDMEQAARVLTAALHELGKQYYDEYPAGVKEVVDAAQQLLEVSELLCSECDLQPVAGVLYDPEATTVQRCDACERFDGDMGAALAVAEKLGLQAWFIRHDHDTGEHRVTLVTREMVDGPDDGWSIAEGTDPWIGDANAEAWSELPDGQNGVITVLPPAG